MRYFMLSVFLVFSLFSFGQISRGGHPYAYPGKKSSTPVYVLPTINHEKAIRENFESEDLINGKKPFRFAENIDVQISPENAGSWVDMGNGLRIWRLILTSGKAYGMSLFFSRFRLEEGSMVFLYDQAQRTVLGGFNSLNNKPSGNLQTDFIPGDTLILELQVSNRKTYGELVISRVSHAFIDVFDKKDGRHGLAGECNIGINCPEGAEWQVIKQSVCRIFIGSRGEFCTGALINDVDSDGTPYLLTANHCIKYPADSQSSVFVFGYESPDCSDTDGSVSLSLSSAVVMATSDSLDFTLLRLSDMPPESYHPYYAGWSRIESPVSKTVVIHHPWGDVKKISKDNDPLLIQYQTVNPPVWLTTGSVPQAFWRVGRWDEGTTEPGSSGAPLFNSQKQIIGNLTGGEAICALPVNDYFSKFFKCWDYYPQSNRRLLNWLDPENTGVQSISGYDPYNSEEPIQYLERFMVYPNPNDGHFTLETDTLSLKGAAISLFTSTGRIIGTYTPQSSRLATFDVSGLESGLYILEIRLGDLLSLRKIIIIK